MLPRRRNCRVAPVAFFCGCAAFCNPSAASLPGFAAEAQKKQSAKQKHRCDPCTDCPEGRLKGSWRMQVDVRLQNDSMCTVSVPVLLAYETMHAISCAGEKQIALSLTGSLGLASYSSVGPSDRHILDLFNRFDVERNPILRFAIGSPARLPSGSCGRPD